MIVPSPMGVDRASFLARTSGALGRHAVVAPPVPPPAVDDSVARVTARDADLLAAFARSATAAGMLVHRTTAAQASERLLALVATLGLRHIAASDPPALPDAAAKLSAAGVDLVPWQTAGFDALYDADAGLTGPHAAIAETGSLVCWSSPAQGRGLSLVPPVHIAIVRRSDILPDLIDYWSRHTGATHGSLPSSLVLITGPSKTADIEGVLITGVHGPREVHILLVEDA